MKFFFFFNSLILFIILLNINYISNNNSEKNKNQKNKGKSKKRIKNHILKRKLFEYFFLRKINNQIVEINEQLSPDFNNYEEINHDDNEILSNNKKDKSKDKSNNDNIITEGYNIESKISENLVVKEDYRKNDFLMRYINMKYDKLNENDINIQTPKNNEKDNSQLAKKDHLSINKNKQQNVNNIHYNQFNRIPHQMNNRFHNNYMPNERNIIVNDYNNYQYQTFDDEFDTGNMDFKQRRNFIEENHRFNSRSSNNYQSSHPTYTSNNQSKSKFTEYMNSMYQIMIVFFFFGLVYKLFFANKQNDKNALEWYEANKDYFKERYEIFGLVEDEETGSFRKDENMKDCIMIKENSNNYKLICGKYRYIKYISVSLQFHKRYDMSVMVASMFVSLKDKIVYQVTFNSVDPCGWVFFIGRNNQCMTIKDNYEDLNLFCEIYHPSFMEEYMSLISEDLDIFVELFKNKRLLQYYKNVEPFIETIYYSDIINLFTEENNIYFSFDIDLSASYQNRIFLEITHFVNVFVDGLAQIKYTKEFKEKVNKNRILYKENKINDSRKKEIEEIEKKNFIEKWKIKNKMKGKSGFERAKLERKLKKYH